jgi:signal peptidase I
MSSHKKLLAALLAVFTICCCGFHGFTFRVPGDSMAPTVKQGDSVFADLFYYKRSPVRRGDIVIVKDPDGKMHSSGREEMYVKRIVGVGGDKIQIVAGKVYVNERVADGVLGTGRYPSSFPVDDFGPIRVPAGQYFLLGDNLADSIDSRQWKHSTVNIDGIYGKVTAIQDGNTRQIRYL